MSKRSHDVEKMNNELGESTRQDVLRILKKWDPSLFVIEMKLETASKMEPMDIELKERLTAAHELFAEAVMNILDAIEVL